MSRLRSGLLACLCGVAACGWGSPPAAPASSAPRFVSLSPAISETLGALGKVDVLVGRSDWCTLPPEVTALPAMGSSLSPRLEALAEVQPATLLLDASLGTQLQELKAVGPVEVLPWLTRDQLLSSVLRLGELTHSEDKAAPLAAAFAAALKTDPPAGEVDNVLLALGGSGLETGEVWFVRRDSLHGAALHGAGARNAVDRDLSGAPMLSLEAVISLDPDAVVVLVQGNLDDAGKQAIIDDWGRLTPLRAVQSHRVRVIAGPTTLSPGPSVIGFVSTLRGVLGELELTLAPAG